MLRNNKVNEIRVLPRPPLHQNDAINNHNFQPVYNPSPKEIPHNKWVVLILKLFAFLLFFLFFIIPVIVKLYPFVLHFVIFLNYVKWPFIPLSCHNTTIHGLEKAYNFYMQVDEQISLGAWHVLPKSLQISEDIELRVSNSKDLFYNNHSIIFYLHGNARDRSSPNRIGLYKLLSGKDFHVVTFDYRGYGDSTGWPSRVGMLEDAMVMFDWLRKTANKNADIFIWGHSLGSAIAIELAKNLSEENIPFSGLILETPFTNIPELAEEHIITACFRWLPYYSWIFTDAIKKADIIFPNDENILEVKGKILILHAEDDNVVPYKHGKKLFEIAKSRNGPYLSKLITYERNLGYGHKLIYTDPKLMDNLIEFINSID